MVVETLAGFGTTESSNILLEISWWSHGNIVVEIFNFTNGCIFLKSYMYYICIIYVLLLEAFSNPGHRFEKDWTPGNYGSQILKVQLQPRHLFWGLLYYFPAIRVGTHQVEFAGGKKHRTQPWWIFQPCSMTPEGIHWAPSYQLV